MSNYEVAVIGGSGAGPAVVREAVKGLNAAALKFQLKLNDTHCDIGGEHCLLTGAIPPDSVPAELSHFSAIPPGGIGQPNVKSAIPRKGILPRTRFKPARATLSAPARAKSDFLSVN